MMWFASDLEFAAPYGLLLALAAIPALLAAVRPRKDGIVVPSSGGVARLRPGLRVRAIRWLPLLRVAAIALLAVAAAGPRVGKAESVIPAEGVDMALSIDTSSSMTASRLGDKNRLEATKDVVRAFIGGLENDRVGIVSFSKTAIALSPPTLDYAALDEIVEGLRTGLLPDGTAIGLGIAEAVNMLRDSTAASRVVILLTDGQHNEPSISPQEAAALAAALKMKVYTIAVVEPGAAPGRASGVDEPLLEAIAEQTGGRHFSARTQEQLAEVYEEIGRLEKSGVGRARFESFTELLAWFAIPAVALLGVEMLLRATWLRRHPG
jgi:Ca-activated chloride channel family protein